MTARIVRNWTLSNHQRLACSPSLPQPWHCFATAMFIHDTNPPGVSTMTELRDQIHYRFLETDRGATVSLTTSSAQATDAIHAFLLFRIVDHQTGDSPAISQKDLPK